MCCHLHVGLTAVRVQWGKAGFSVAPSVHAAFTFDKLRLMNFAQGKSHLRLFAAGSLVDVRNRCMCPAPPACRRHGMTAVIVVQLLVAFVHTHLGLHAPHAAHARAVWCMQARQFCRRYQRGTDRPLWLSTADRDSWVLPVTIHAMLYTPAELAFVLALAVHAACDVNEHFKSKGGKALRRTVEAMLGFHMIRSSRVAPAPPRSAADRHRRAAAHADDDTHAATPLLLRLPADSPGAGGALAMNGAAAAAAPVPHTTRVMWRDAACSAAAVRRQSALEAEPGHSFADATTATLQPASGSARRSSVVALLGVLALAAQWRGNSAARFVRAWLQVCQFCMQEMQHMLCTRASAQVLTAYSDVTSQYANNVNVFVAKQVHHVQAYKRSACSAAGAAIQSGPCTAASAASATFRVNIPVQSWQAPTRHLGHPSA